MAERPERDHPTTANTKQLILIVEDALTYQQALRRAFLEKKYDVMCAGNLKEAWQNITHHRPLLLILDIRLPDGDGKEFCKEIKMNVSYCMLPVMMLTMNKAEESIVEGLEAGADSYINKNEPLDVIVRRAEELLRVTRETGSLIPIDDGEVSFNNKKILIVEDDITYLQAAKRELKEIGYQVATVMSGQGCLEHLKKETPSIVLCDLRMPEMDGAEVCRNIRKDKKMHNLPVVLLTASNSQEDVVRSFDAGVTDYIVKGTNFKALHARIQAILKRHRFQEVMLSRMSEVQRKALIADAEKEAERKYAAELSIKNKELEKVNMELDAFAYTISHDLRSPLRTIVGFSQIVMAKNKEKLDKKAQEYLTRVIEYGQKLEDMMAAILEFSRIGRAEAEKEEIDLRQLVDEVLKLIEVDIKEKQATIKVEGSFPTMFCYKERVKQVFLNLIGNSLKYVPEHTSPRIIIGCTRRDNHPWCYIKDNGIGIPKEYHEKVFQIFSRLHTENSPYKGTGVGLTNVKKIIDLHQGHIYFDSHDGAGTTVYFTFKKPKL